MMKQEEEKLFVFKRKTIENYEVKKTLQTFFNIFLRTFSIPS